MKKLILFAMLTIAVNVIGQSTPVYEFKIASINTTTNPARIASVTIKSVVATNWVFVEQLDAIRSLKHEEGIITSNTVATIQWGNKSTNFLLESITIKKLGRLTWDKE